MAIDRTTKFAFVRLELKANMATASAVLEALIEALPCRVHTALTDNGVQVADLSTNRDGPKTLRGLTPDAFICKVWADQTDRFIQDPIQQSPGPYT